MTRNDVFAEIPAYRAVAYKSKNSYLTAVSAMTVESKQKQPATAEYLPEQCNDSRN